MKPYNLSLLVSIFVSSQVVVSQQVLHHHPAHWDSPDLFNPDRFVEESRTVKPFTYIPFIVGPRRCLGKNFAMSEIKVPLNTPIVLNC